MVALIANRDGTVAKGGCTFCSVSGSGDMIVAPSDPLPLQFQKEIQLMHQNGQLSINTLFTSKISPIHAPVDVIRHRFEQVVTKRCRWFIHWYPS